MANPEVPTVPDSYSRVLETFGRIPEYIGSDGTLSPVWEMERIVRIPLPYPLTLGWTPRAIVTQIACHRLLAATVASVFQTFKDQNWEERPECMLFGGCFMYRPIRGRNALSLHSFGIAVDMDPEEYPLGSRKRMPEEIVKVWTDRGFRYGGDFEGRKDPQHFQYATHC